MERYLFTVASLYSSDKEFKDFFSSSKGLCLHHSLLLGEMADEALKGDELISFIHDLISLLEKNLDRVQKDDWWMTQKYKSENKDKPWNGAEDAHKRAVEKLVGKVRVIDPAKSK